MSKPDINKNICIEDLVNYYPFSIKYLSQKGVKCIICGESIWGTLEEAAKEKNFNDPQIETIVEELKKMDKVK